MGKSHKNIVNSINLKNVHTLKNTIIRVKKYISIVKAICVTCNQTNLQHHLSCSKNGVILLTRASIKYNPAAIQTHKTALSFQITDCRMKRLNFKHFSTLVWVYPSLPPSRLDPIPDSGHFASSCSALAVALVQHHRNCFLSTTPSESARGPLGKLSFCSILSFLFGLFWCPLWCVPSQCTVIIFPGGSFFFSLLKQERYEFIQFP